MRWGVRRKALVEWRSDGGRGGQPETGVRPSESARTSVQSVCAEDSIEGSGKASAAWACGQEEAEAEEERGGGWGVSRWPAPEVKAGAGKGEASKAGRAGEAYRPSPRPALSIDAGTEEDPRAATGRADTSGGGATAPSAPEPGVAPLAAGVGDGRTGGKTAEEAWLSAGEAEGRAVEGTERRDPAVVGAAEGAPERWLLKGSITLLSAERTWRGLQASSLAASSGSAARGAVPAAL